MSRCRRRCFLGDERCAVPTIGSPHAQIYNSTRRSYSYQRSRYNSCTASWSESRRLLSLLWHTFFILISHAPCAARLSVFNVTGNMSSVPIALGTNALPKRKPRSSQICPVSAECAPRLGQRAAPRSQDESTCSTTCQSCDAPLLQLTENLVAGFCLDLESCRTFLQLICCFITLWDKVFIANLTLKYNKRLHLLI